jgi:hypothetical protein
VNGIGKEDGEEESKQIGKRMEEKEFKTTAIRSTPKLYSRRKETK